MDLQNLESALTFVEHKFGMDWLKDWVEKLKELDPERTTTGRYINLWEAGICPAALMWFKCREQLAIHYLNGQLEASPEVLLLLRLVDDMKTVENFNGFQTRFECLKNASQYYAAEYEIHIAAGYAKAGQRISFAQQNGVFKVEEQELTVVAFKEGAGVYVPMADPLPVAGKGVMLCYIDYTMAPGEDPVEGLRHRAEILRGKVTQGEVDNVICTTTVFGNQSRGCWLIEKALPLWETDKSLNIFLPDTDWRA